MKEVLLTFLSELAEGLLLAFVPVLVSMATAWLYAKMRLAWANFKNENAGPAYVIEQVALMAVKAAEQAKLAELIEDKKSYAVQTAELWLKEKGFNVDLAVIEAAIEAAVYEQFTELQSS